MSAAAGSSHAPAPLASPAAGVAELMRSMPPEARDLAAQYSGEAKSAARKKAGEDWGLRDLIESDCMLALCKAAMTYDPKKLVKLPESALLARARRLGGFHEAQSVEGVEGAPGGPEWLEANSLTTVKFHTYAHTACKREAAKSLARHLRKREGTESLGKGEGMVPDLSGADPSCDASLFGSMQPAVDALPEGQKRALSAWFAQEGEPSLSLAPRSVRAALAQLAGEAVPFEEASKADASSPPPAAWSQPEKAFLWRMIRAGRCRPGSKGERRCAERLNRPLKSVRRRVARMQAAGEAPKERREGKVAARSILTPEADMRRRAAEAGWEILDGGFFGEVRWVCEATGDVATWEEVVVRLGGAR